MTDWKTRHNSRRAWHHRAAMVLAIGAALLASCTSAPRYRSTPSYDDAPRTLNDATRSDVVEVAKSYLGTPYRNGGASRNGVDCSGLVMTVYEQFDVLLPRTSLDQSRVGRSIDRSELAPGDLVFFRTSRRSSVSHVGIYIGNGRFIHASTSARRVRTDRLSDDYFASRFVTAQRVLEN